MITPSDEDVLEAMVRYGGSFIVHLSRAARCADSQNLAKIKANWPGEWKKYAAIAAQDREEQ